MGRRIKFFLPLLLILALLAADAYLLDYFVPPAPDPEPTPEAVTTPEPEEVFPEYAGEPFIALEGEADFSGVPTVEAFESYAELDSLGRCGEALALLGPETMPKEERQDISSVTPSGWNNAEYSFIDGGYLYNRCHLIGFQLSGENDNPKNLITGTRYMNMAMLRFENITARYIRETGNHVLYRVRPVFREDEAVCRGVIMEGQSLEDGGQGLSFRIYAFNVQPGVIIDHTDGSSTMDEALLNSGERRDYILNTGSGKFHLPGCQGAESISDKNRRDFTGTRDWLIAIGYEPCGICQP